jgi:hypothetical protein
MHHKKMTIMSLISKLKGVKDLLLIQQVETEFGPGYKAVVQIGNAQKVCHLIQDKATGEWKPLGDENACAILAANLAQLGTPLTGKTSAEKVQQS